MKTVQQIMAESNALQNIELMKLRMEWDAMEILLIFALTITFIAWACVIVGGRSEK